MNCVRPRAVTLLLALIFLAACDSADPIDSLDRREREQASPDALEPGGNCATVGGYEVCLVATVGETGVSTTFTYQVSPAGATAHLRHLVLGYETCEPALEFATSDPDGTPTADPVTGVTGVLIEEMQRKNEVKDYSVTFAGDVPTGLTQVGIAVGSLVESAAIAGPACEPVTYDIDGSVYIESDAFEADDYGIRDGGEAGVGNVTVRLTRPDGSPVLDAVGVPRASVTDSDGAFAFDDLPAGNYHILVPPATTDDDDNNETLHLEQDGLPLYGFANPDAVVTPTGDKAVPVSLGPDAVVHVGFAPDADAVAAALDGALATRNTLPFTHFLPLLSGLAEPDAIADGTVPYYSLPVGSFDLGFLGRSYDASLDRTTYSYRLSRRTGRGADVSHITFGVEECAPVAYEPDRVTRGTDPTTGVDGVKFDFGVRREQFYALTFAGDVEPGVIDVGVKYGTNVTVVPMPGACADGIGTVNELMSSLDEVYYGGPADPSFLFLSDPLLLPAGKSELSAAIELLMQQNVALYGATYLQQYLLVAQIIYARGLGTPNPVFDITLFQFVEPIVLFESTGQSAGKTGGIEAGTGGSTAGGSVLRGYVAW